MSPREDLSPEYVEARRVLLDALDALGPQSAAVVLAGAQAIYLRTGPGSLAIAAYTTDGDLAVDPALLDDAPPLGELMEAGGFRLTEHRGAKEPGIWEAPAEINGREVMIPVDLIVPAGVAPVGGTRGARLGSHGKRAARKTVGLEAALVDNDAMPIEALDPAALRTCARALPGPVRRSGRGRHRDGGSRSARSDARRAGAGDLPRLQRRAVRVAVVGRQPATQRLASSRPSRSRIRTSPGVSQVNMRIALATRL